jgi:hypothetical protein
MTPITFIVKSVCKFFKVKFEVSLAFSKQFYCTHECQYQEEAIESKRHLMEEQ